MKFKFEIHASKEVLIDAENKEEARMKVINNLENLSDDIVNGSTYVDDGTDVTDDYTNGEIK